MFERFTGSAREVVVDAQSEARKLHHGHIGTEHLLLAMLSARRREVSLILGELGLGYEQAADRISRYIGTDDLDADALGVIGIDLAAVREKIEETFGPGALDRAPGTPKPTGRHIPFTPRARKTLELSLREALLRKHKYIADGHILLGILRDGEGLAMKVITEAGIDPAAIRSRLTFPRD
jgi:ATP-dependent Clp protease ATP-binding subunit ClpA